DTVARDRGRGRARRQPGGHGDRLRRRDGGHPPLSGGASGRYATSARDRAPAGPTASVAGGAAAAGHAVGLRRPNIHRSTAPPQRRSATRMTTMTRATAKRSVISPSTPTASDAPIA